MATRVDPVRNFRFHLEIDSITRAGFSEVAVADTTVDVVEYREGNGPPHVNKLSGLTKYGNVTLKSGVTSGANSLELFKWHSDVSAGLISQRRKNIAISVHDESGKTEVARFAITDAWPIKYHSGDLNAKGNEVVIELLELANEGIERVK